MRTAFIAFFFLVVQLWTITAQDPAQDPPSENSVAYKLQQEIEKAYLYGLPLPLIGPNNTVITG